MNEHINTSHSIFFQLAHFNDHVNFIFYISYSPQLEKTNLTYAWNHYVVIYVFLL